MAEEQVQRSLLSIEERAAIDATETHEDGTLVNHVYHSDIKEFHEERARVDDDYKPASAEASERLAERRDRENEDRKARGEKPVKWGSK